MGVFGADLKITTCFGRRRCPRALSSLSPLGKAPPLGKHLSQPLAPVNRLSSLAYIATALPLSSPAEECRRIPAH